MAWGLGLSYGHLGIDIRGAVPELWYFRRAAGHHIAHCLPAHPTPDALSRDRPGLPLVLQGPLLLLRNRAAEHSVLQRQDRVLRAEMFVQ